MDPAINLYELLRHYKAITGIEYEPTSIYVTDVKGMTHKIDSVKHFQLKIRVKKNPGQNDNGTYDIWSEGYQATGDSGKATCHAVGVKANSFKEACDVFFSINSISDGNFNLEKLTYWGCSLFPTEDEARKSFG